jgi:hypothetical protein
VLRESGTLRFLKSRFGGNAAKDDTLKMRRGGQARIKGDAAELREDES